MPKVEQAKLPTYSGPDSAEPFAGPLGDYIGRSVSKGHGLRFLGVNIETLQPGSSSSHRHWHDRSDELVVVLKGELVLIEDTGETILRPGEVAAFPAGVPNGHCLRNDSDGPADFVVVGSHHQDDCCHYSDIDLVVHPGGVLKRRDGSAAIPTR